MNYHRIYHFHTRHNICEAPKNGSTCFLLNVAFLMQQLHQKILRCFLYNPCIGSIILHGINFTLWVTHRTQTVSPLLLQAVHQSQSRFSMHNRLGKTIAENEVWELWAFSNYSNISIFLRAHWENALAILTRIKKRLAEFCSPVTEMLCFAKLKKALDQWGKKDYKYRTARFQPVVQSRQEIRQLFTSNGSTEDN